MQKNPFVDQRVAGSTGYTFNGGAVRSWHQIYVHKNTLMHVKFQMCLRYGSCYYLIEVSFSNKDGF